LTGEELVPGIIVAVQTFGDRINFHPHLHLLLTEGGMDRTGIFHRLPRLDEAPLDTCPGPGYPDFVRGRVDSEPEAGDSMPLQKRNFLSFLPKKARQDLD
jgi:hypothetical protein